jgi:predicted CoA-binding protein
MPSSYETFFNHASFAVAGHSATKPFPALTYAGLKKLGKKVYPVDPGCNTIAGDKAYPDLASLPEPVEAVVVEVRPDETDAWVEKAAQAGIKDVWLHQNSDTPRAFEVAREHGIDLRHGTCAVMYVTPGLTFHSIHRWLQKACGAY